MNREKLAPVLFKALTLVAIIFCSCIILQSNTALAASSKTNALKAYKQFLLQETTTWNPSSSTRVTLSKCKFAIVYIDDNSVPELVLACGSNSNSHADGYYTLYTYKNGEVTYVTNLMDGFSYYKKKGQLI